MFSLLLLCSTTSILPIIVSAQLPIWPLEDSYGSEGLIWPPEDSFGPEGLIWPPEPLFGPELPPDQATFSSDLTLLPLDQDSLFDDTSDPLFANLDNSIPTVSETGFDGVDFFSTDDSLDFVDCSASLFPTIVESRIRREDKPGSCKNPPGNADTPPPDVEETQSGLEDKFGQLLWQQPTESQISEQKKAFPEQNPNCFRYSGQTLPWGVCSSGNPLDVTPILNPLVLSQFGEFVRYNLDHSTLGTKVSSVLFFFFFNKKKKIKKFIILFIQKFFIIFFSFFFFFFFLEQNPIPNFHPFFSFADFTKKLKISSAGLSNVLSDSGVGTLLLSSLPSTPCPRNRMCGIPSARL